MPNQSNSENWKQSENLLKLLHLKGSYEKLIFFPQKFWIYDLDDQ